MSAEDAERRLARETEDYERQISEDRAKDHAPATSTEERRGGRFDLQWPVTIKTRRRVNHWLAEVPGGNWETGATEAEALGNLLMRLALRHAPGCRRPYHFGPCSGVLRSERSESPREDAERRVDAIVAVLRGRLPGFTEQTARRIAEQCFDAGELGF